MKVRSFWPAGILVSAFLVAACGGGEPPKPPPAPPATASPPQATVQKTPTAEGAQWQLLESVGTVPSPRRDHTLVLDGHRGLLLFGGRVEGRGLADLWRYDLEANRWQQLQPQGLQPPARWGHLAVFDADGDRLLVFSGQGSGGFFNDLWAYDAERNRWEELRPSGPIPSTRYGAGIAYDATRRLAYVTHGFTSAGRFDDTWAIGAPSDAWTDVSPDGTRPLRRCLLEVAYDPVQDAVLLFGGQSNEKPFHGDLWAFDPRARAWREVPGSGPEPRHFSSLVVDAAGKRGLVFGGLSAQGRLADLWALDLAAYRWQALAVAGPGPAPRDGHDAVFDAVGNQMLLFGGSDGSEKSDLWAVRFTP